MTKTTNGNGVAEIRVWNVPERLKVLLNIAAAEEQLNKNDLYIKAFEEWIASRKSPKLPK